MVTRRSWGPLALAIAFGLATAACEQAPRAGADGEAMGEAAQAAENGAMMEAPELPDTTGAAVWAYLNEVNYQESWQTWPDKGELYRGQEPHGMLLTTYLNPLAYDALTNKAGEFPANAIVVKENYMPDSTLAAVTTMYKVEGYNAEANDWFWVKHLPDGRVDANGNAQGRVGTCIGCHGQRADNDYIFTGSLSESMDGEGM